MQFKQCILNERRKLEFYGGNFGYELKQECSPKDSILQTSAERMPYAMFLFAGRVIVFDHIKQELCLVSSSLTVEPSQEWFVVVEDRLGKVTQPQKAPIMSSMSGPLEGIQSLRNSL
jgi:anthranilate/para-aminobenzoate synthase component I